MRRRQAVQKILRQKRSVAGRAMKLQLGNCDAGCSDGEASNKAPQENDDPDSSFYERGVSFSSLRQAAQFDVPANKRFLEAATQQAVTQRQRNM